MNPKQLDRRDLEIEKRLEIMDLKALKDSTTNKSLPSSDFSEQKTIKTLEKLARKKPIVAREVPSSGTPDAIRQKDLRDLVLEVQLQKMTNNAFRDEISQNEPRKIISSVN